LGNTTAYEYDPLGNLLRSTSPLLNVTKYDYNGLGQQTESTDPAGGKTHYAYDKTGRVTQVTDPNGAITRYEYDGLGNLVKQHSADTGVTTYTYDAAGNLLTKTDANKITTAYRYDALNRLTAIDYTDDGLDVTLTYDEGAYGKGRLTTLTDGSGSTRYRYTALGQVAEQTTTIGQHSYTLTYRYRPGGALAEVTYPSGRVLTYQYNTHGQLSGISQQHREQTKALVTDIIYQPFGPLSRYTLGNGKTVSRQFDLAGRLTEIHLLGVYHSQLSYDADGNIRLMEQPHMPARQQQFSYDALNRLTEAYGAYGDYAYNYDPVGNRTALTQDNDTDTWQYQAQSNRLTLPYAHDEAGNRIADTAHLYRYGAHNRMIELIDRQRHMSTDYGYNGLGQRVIKANLFGQVEFIYDGAGQLIAEADSEGLVVKEYIPLGGQPLVMAVE
ncbi:RHS repeat protein, partial [Corallincola spongiicola]|uniref:RHS repeat protein n=1 Tax=Corallincola spongiicola TaxID=2520508 RepID=UPI0013EE5A5B